MKKLDIPNYESLKGFRINEWEIYAAADTGMSITGKYVFRLKRICGHPKHGAVSIDKNIDDDGTIKVTLMYESYTNQFYSWNPKLSTMRDKMAFWKAIEFYIEKEHQKYL